MNILNLVFDLSPGAEPADTDDLRSELSKLLDENLKTAGQGLWVASKFKSGRLQVKCSVHDPELACAQIKQALSKHWIIKHLLPSIS